MIAPQNQVGRVRRYVRLERQADVRVPDNALKGVGFISEVAHSDSSGDDLDHYATGFFVTKPSSIKGLMSMYFVTAKHVAQAIDGKDFRLVVNKKGGGIKEFSGIGNVFWGHPTDSTADVAVLPINPESDMDIVHTSTRDFITIRTSPSAAPNQAGRLVSLRALPATMQRMRIGIGDEVFITGLFSYAPGTRRIMPIIRHGNIAMLPEEQIQTTLGFADAYLIEARSIGGLSGSPVFARQKILLSKGEGENPEPVFAVSGDMKLLGIVQGHWDISESEMNKARYRHDPLRGVNIGIAVVTPAFKILETLERTELVKLRMQMEEEYSKSVTPSADSGSGAPLKE